MLLSPQPRTVHKFDLDSLAISIHSARFGCMKDNTLLIVAALGCLIIRVLFRRRRDQEILMLRKELQILSRQIRKPKLSAWDRLFFVSLFKSNPHVITRAVIIKPSTVIAWHRSLVKRKWTYSKKNCGRPPALLHNDFFQFRAYPPSNYPYIS